MKIRLKPVAEQVIVITGASSGIGLVTARMAARNGARVVLISRNESALQDAVNSIRGEGGKACAVRGDVCSADDMNRAADAAVQTFGAIDTWVNNAGVAIYGRIEDVPVDDMRQLFETDFWGVVQGSLAAVKVLKRRGGALINIGSVLSDRAVPLQGIYSAAKHAVKGFTDSLRMELEKEKAPISVTLIKPSAIDTMYLDHAKNYLPREPNLPPPVYAPEVVAKAILHAAQTPVRDILVGAGAKMLSAGGYHAPRAMDKYMEWMMYDRQIGEQPARAERKDNLYGPAEDSKERQGYDGRVRESSVYTKATLNPDITLAAIALGALATSALWRWRQALKR